MPSTDRDECIFSIMKRKGLSIGPKTSRSDAVGPLDFGVPEVAGPVDFEPRVIEMIRLMQQPTGRPHHHVLLTRPWGM